MAKYYYKKYSIIDGNVLSRSNVTINMHEVSYLDRTEKTIPHYSNLGTPSYNYSASQTKKRNPPATFEELVRLGYKYWVSESAYSYSPKVRPDSYAYGIYYFELKSVNSDGTGGVFDVYKRGDVRGSYIGEVIAEDGTYPANGKHTDGYWYVRDRLANEAPTISDTDEDLGPQRKPFTKDFYVDDTDTTQTLNVTIKLNGATIQTISNATRKQNYTVDIDQATFDDLTLNAVNTIEISVSDGNGATAVRRWTFTRSNSNPTVSVDITNAGEQNLPFSVAFTPDDQDGDEITCKVFIDDVQVADLGSVTRGEKKTYALGKMDFSKLRNGAHKVKIEVTDTNGGKGYGFVDFTKNLTSAYYKFTKETEGQALFVTVQLMAEIAEGAKVTVKVCNNALDTAPTWEEIPSEKVGEGYKFNNSTKTASNWAVGIWIQIDRGSATKDSYWYGAVGSYR